MADTTTDPAALAADVPQAGPTALTPEEIMDQLRAISARMGELAPMSAAQRKALRGRLRTPDPILSASISVLDVHDNVTLAVGQPGEGVRSLQMEAILWGAVEAQLRTMLNSVSGANLLRRLRIDLIAAQAYAIGSQLARDPANAVLLPQVEEVKHLKKVSRRRKAAQAPDTPPSPEV
jgi:hypothetical protein